MIQSEVTCPGLHHLGVADQFKITLIVFFNVFN
jgi:hypothetical protein